MSSCGTRQSKSSRKPGNLIKNEHKRRRKGMQPRRKRNRRKIRKRRSKRLAVKASQRVRRAARRRSVGNGRKPSESRGRRKRPRRMRKSRRPQMTLMLRALRPQSRSQQSKYLYQTSFLRDRLVSGSSRPHQRPTCTSLGI